MKFKGTKVRIHMAEGLRKGTSMERVFTKRDNRE